VWRNHTFLPLWIGLLVSNVGDWITYVAMYAVVYQQTHSALALVGLRLVHLVPELLLASVAGVFVDRWSRKTTLVISPLVSALVVAPLLVAHPVALIFVAELALTLVAMFFDPAVSAAIPAIVGPEDLSAANALTQITGTLATLVGGLSGGLLVSALGARVAFGFDVISFLVIAALITTVRVREEARPPSVASIERELREGVRCLHDRPLVTAVVTAGALFVFAPSSIFTVGIVFAQSVLHAGAAGYGVLLAGLGAGSMVGALGMIVLRTRPREDLVFAVTGIALGAAFALMGLSRSLTPATSLYGIAGCMSLINGVAAVTLVQRLVPDQLRGRIFGVASSLNHLAAFAGAVLIAAVVGVLGAGGVITASGAIAGFAGLCVLVVILRGIRA
jgi:MFS family permease